MRLRQALIPAAVAAALTAGCSPFGIVNHAGPATSTSTTAPTTPSGTVPVTPTPSHPTNGMEFKPAAEVESLAKKALLGASSVRIKGTVHENGETIALDMHLKGTDGSTGTITQNGTDMHLLIIGKVAYISGDDTFWSKTVGKGAVATLRGKYLKMTSSNPDFKDLLVFGSVTKLAAMFLPDEPLIRIGQQPVNGSRTLILKGAGDTYFVALDGPPYPLRLSGGDSKTSAVIDFLDYGKPVTLTAPPKSKIFSVPS